MKTTSREEAWKTVNEFFPTDYEEDASSSERAGYPIFRSTAEDHYYDYICDLNNRLEVNLSTGKTVNIWVEADNAENNDLSEARKETGKRIQRLTYWFTDEYVKELDNKKREDAAVREMEESHNPNEIMCMVLTAENNAKVMMSCITECIHAVNLLGDKDRDVDDWMLTGINAMMDKASESRTIPFDLPLSINGLLCAQYR